MTKEIQQAEVWDGEFGRKYVERNAKSVSTMKQNYDDKYGISRKELNEQFIGDLPRDLRILEVGVGVGVQLEALNQMGFSDLYGIDIQSYAIEESHEKFPHLNTIEGNALDIPFKNGFFDLVFTTNLLIHIPPDKIEAAIGEIARCSEQYVWGSEFFADEYTQIDYRDQENLLWKTDFKSIYVEHGLTEIQTKRLEYEDSDNEDEMFLLEV